MKLLCLTLIALLASTFVFAVTIQPAKADEIIVINADGSISPPTAPISTLDNVTYTFIGGIINESVVVQRDNVILDGAGFILQGSGQRHGIDLSGDRSNVTVKNIQIEGFLYGIRLEQSSNCTVECNRISETSEGISLGGSGWYSNDNVISRNNITECDMAITVWLGWSNTFSENILSNNRVGFHFDNTSSANRIFHNDFMNNTYQGGSYRLARGQLWDNGYPSGGNFWSDYSGVDLKNGPNQDQNGSDGIGDTPYVISPEGDFQIMQDHYPLATPYGSNLPFAYPTACFTYAPTYPIASQPVVFNASTSTCLNGSISQYNWNFGDGASGTGETVSHSYASHGNYNVTLIVLSNTLIPDAQEQFVSVRELPIAAFSFSPTLDVGYPVTFDASASDPRGGNITGYVWDFEDGNTTSTVNPITNHTFTSANTFNVTLTILDSEGLNSSISETLLVIMPTVSFSSSPSPIVGHPVTFDATISDSQGGSVIDYLWDFGDGNTTSTISSVVSHIYTFQNTFNVSLTVLDGEGLNSSCSNTILVMMPTALSVSTNSTSTVLSYIVNVYGNLSDAHGNGVKNEIVMLHYTFPGSSTWYPISSASTDAHGEYYVQWMPSATGDFTIEAEWAGNATHIASNGKLNLCVLPYESTYAFSVESNSTVSDLSFDTTSQRLSFSTSGENGTTGDARVTISKALVPDITRLKVRLDGIDYNYSAASLDDSWLLTFTYSHSTHQVQVYLDINAIPEYPSATMLAVLIISTALMAAALFKKKRAHMSKATRTQNTNPI